MTSLPSLQTLLVFEHRESRRSKIYKFFEKSLGLSFSSKYLHDTFGSSFRTRVSEINRDPTSAIKILNEYSFDNLGQREVSSYKAEPK